MVSGANVAERSKRILFWAVGVFLVAPSAVAQSEVPGTTEVSPDPPSEAAPHIPAPFGSQGQWVLLGSSNVLGISNESFSQSQAKYFYAGGGIGIDTFVIRNFSIGLDLEASYANRQGYGATTLTKTTSAQLAGGVRLGLNVPIGMLWSWYPRLTLGLDWSHANVDAQSSVIGVPGSPPFSQSSVGPWFNLYAPVLVHPVSNFFVGLGPRIQHDLGVFRGGPYDGSQPTLLAADFTVGGWWGGPSVESPAPARAANLGDAFGAAGHLVLTTATDASVWSQSYSKSKGSSTNVNLEPSLDYFATENVSIGVDAFIAYQQGTSLDSAQATTNFSATSIGFAPRIGANIPATAALSVWPQIELGYGTVSTNETSVNGTNQHTRKLSWVELSAPVLVHPASHFFVGAGPYVFHELSDADQHDYENDATTLGAKLVLGGWL